MYIWSYWGEHIREICQLREMIDNQQAVDAVVAVAATNL